jgi:hypothetical protein
VKEGYPSPLSLRERVRVRTFVVWTLKASHKTAQGEPSGAAAKRHPGFGFRKSPFSPERAAQTNVWAKN